MTAITFGIDGTSDDAPLAAEEYLPFIRRIARRMARRLPAHISLDELVSAGAVGLLEAMKRFDPTRVKSFETFAEFRVRGAMLDELRRRDLMARDARIESKHLERVTNVLSHRLGRAPEDEELAATLEVSVASLRAKRRKLQPVALVDIEEVPQRTTATATPPPDEALTRKQDAQQLVRALARLNERQQRVLELYYREEKTLREIGLLLGVTESRVCQIVSESTRRLRTLMGVRIQSTRARNRRCTEQRRSVGHR